MTTQRRGFLKALAGSGAAIAATAMTATVAPQAPKVVEIIKEKMIWPTTLPPLITRDGWPKDGETMTEEQHRLLVMLLSAETELLTMPGDQDVIWNGLGFRLKQGPNVVPGPIANVYRQSVEDMEAGNRELFARVSGKYSHTFRG